MGKFSAGTVRYPGTVGYGTKIESYVQYVHSKSLLPVLSIFLLTVEEFLLSFTKFTFYDNGNNGTVWKWNEKIILKYYFIVRKKIWRDIFLAFYPYYILLTSTGMYFLCYVVFFLLITLCEDTVNKTTNMFVSTYVYTERTYEDNKRVPKLHFLNSTFQYGMVRYRTKLYQYGSVRYHKSTVW